jgi:hypothetical protein
VFVPVVRICCPFSFHINEFLKINLNIVVPSFQVLQPKFCMYFPSVLATWPRQSHYCSSYHLIFCEVYILWSFLLCNFSCLLLLTLSQVCVFSAPCSQTPSIHQYNTAIQCFSKFRQSRTTSLAVGAHADHRYIISYTLKCMHMNRRNVLVVTVTILHFFCTFFWSIF